MHTVAQVLIGVVAALHVYFLVLEMFLWQRPPGRALSGFDADTARLTAPLAANQGLYNGFLAAGWSGRWSSTRWPRRSSSSSA